MIAKEELCLMTSHSGRIDLHMHTTVSDGTDSPNEILDKIRNAGVNVFSVTDHDAVKGCCIIQSLLNPGDPAFFTGVEFSCKDENGKYHILGYGFDPEAEPILRVVQTGHDYRMNKIRIRLDFLKKRFGIDFPKEEIRRLLALDNPGKPHIGNLMMKYGYARSMNEAIKDYMDQMRIRSEYVRPEDAISGILASGGVPVLAHPCYGSGDELILGPDLEDRVRRLMDFGLRGLEAYYSGFSSKLRSQVLSLAERLELCVTAGSDYHGKNKLIPIGDTGLEEDNVRVLDSFFEEIKNGEHGSI